MQAFPTNTDPVPEGMTLAQPVLDAHGQLLLPAGTPLTRGILRSLQQRDIETVFVQLPETDPAAGAKPAQPAESAVKAIRISTSRISSRMRWVRLARRKRRPTGASSSGGGGRCAMRLLSTRMRNSPGATAL